MKLGIIGLPNVGKSTLFNALTRAGAASANYPFCTIDPNVGRVPVPDVRLTKLAEMFHPEKITPAIVDFVDIAGLVRGASKGEGLGNQFLSHIREVDALCHVVRCFDDPNVVHVEGSADPARDIEIIELELILSDMELTARRIDKAAKLAKGDRKFQQDVDLFTRLKEHLDKGLSARAFEITPEEAERLDIPLLSRKPVIYCANVSDTPEADAPHVSVVREIAERESASVLTVSARLEEELSTLSDDEVTLFLSELGLSSSGLDRLIEASYTLLGLISYLTAGSPEVRAWTIKKGTRAPQAAGVIHSDFERGFIRAEVVAYDDLMRVGSMAAAKEQGLVRSEGKEYVMRDGDVTLFRFNV